MIPTSFSGDWLTAAIAETDRHVEMGLSDWGMF